jgi:hypothetical protein
MLNGVLQSQDTPLGLGLITDICILLSHPNHDTSVAWTTNYTWENSTWSIISSKASLFEMKAIT